MLGLNMPTPNASQEWQLSSLLQVNILVRVLYICKSIITWPKNFVFGQVLFSSACMCLSVCVSVCVWVSLYLNYLKKFLTDFDETWQDDW